MKKILIGGLGLLALLMLTLLVYSALSKGVHMILEGEESAGKKIIWFVAFLAALQLQDTVVKIYRLIKKT